MESATQTVLLVSFSTLVIGLIFGLLIGRSNIGSRSKGALIEELNEARRELEAYKLDVATRFTQTAELVNKLTDSYRDVHQHLSNSARELCNDDQLLVSLEHRTDPAAEQEAAPEQQSTSESQVEPPRDYAPKTDPEAEGTLSEEYGLKKEEEVQEPSRMA
ncbi:YhcB family protein [Motiliproteus sp.]|uniref:YhcB family protein n=1 Tax=Motiliproteus sp. TaxID=1898955 RepID=UPI003BA947C1